MFEKNLTTFSNILTVNVKVYSKIDVFHIQKYLFEYIKSLNWYEITKRCLPQLNAGCTSTLCCIPLFVHYIHAFFEIPQVPFVFDSEWQNGTLVTKQSLNYHLTIRQSFPNLTNGNLATVLSPNCHSAVQTQTQTQTEPEVYRIHIHGVIPQSRNLQNPSILQENKTTFENGLHNCMSDIGGKMYRIKLNGDRRLFAE